MLNGAGATAPFTSTVITGSTNTISAPSPQITQSATSTFSSWSDGGSATHNIVANSDSSYTATFQTTLAPPDTVIDSLTTFLGGKATPVFHGVWRSPSSSRSFSAR